MNDTILKMQGISKFYGGIKALEKVDFELYRGEILCLLGENGAGKSTLMKILSGVIEPSEGEIFLEDKKINIKNPNIAHHLGISTVHQELVQFADMTIMENIYMGRYPKKGGLVDFKTLKEKTLALMDSLDIHFNPFSYIRDLSVAQRQMVEIMKAVSFDSKIIIFDEPTSSLTTSETAHLFDIIRQLKAEGKGIVYISHKMDEIKEIGDVITVLKDGTYVGTRNVKEITLDDVIRMMVGREIKGTYRNEETEDFDKEPVIFEARNISRRDGKVRDVSFQVRKGEIVGFAGLVGAGRSELMNALFGAEPKLSGQVFIGGREVTIRSPYEAIKNGLAMVTENRRETGFLNNFSIKQNISIVPFLKTSKGNGLIGLLDNKAEEEYAAKQKKDMNIKCRDVEQNITELSGGNQQKVILGKWMAAESSVIIFDEPTKGIDVGSKSEIYVLMRRLASQGKGVIMVSSEMPELLSVCDTICVFRDGGIRMTYAVREATEEKILKSSTGEE